MTSKFKVGDAVMIRPSSEFYTAGNLSNPIDTTGKIISRHCEDDAYPYRVYWDNDTTNTYEASDLILVEKVPRESIHDILVERSTLEVGDIVIVTHKVPSNDLGWSNSWLSSMDGAVGKECEVMEAPDFEGVILGGLGEGYGYPLQSVQFVRKGLKKINVQISEDYNALVSEDNIKVGCQTITFTAFDELAEAVAKMRK